MFGTLLLLPSSSCGGLGASINMHMNRVRVTLQDEETVDSGKVGIKLLCLFVLLDNWLLKYCKLECSPFGSLLVPPPSSCGGLEAKIKVHRNRVRVTL